MLRCFAESEKRVQGIRKVNGENKISPIAPRKGFGIEFTRIVIVNNHGSCIGLVKSELLCDAAFATMIVGMNKNFQGVGVITEDMESASANEKLGFTGREEGISAYAVCLIEK